MYLSTVLHLIIVNLTMLRSWCFCSIELSSIMRKEIYIHFLCQYEKELIIHANLEDSWFLPIGFHFRTCDEEKIPTDIMFKKHVFSFLRIFRILISDNLFQNVSNFGKRQFKWNQYVYVFIYCKYCQNEACCYNNNSNSTENIQEHRNVCQTFSRKK